MEDARRHSLSKGRAAAFEANYGSFNRFMNPLTEEICGDRMIQKSAVETSDHADGRDNQGIERFTVFILPVMRLEAPITLQVRVIRAIRGEVELWKFG